METATLIEQLEAFFEQHDSSRLGEIDLIIDSYRGREFSSNFTPSFYHHQTMIQ
jgi:hypothetical protein